MSVGYYTGTPPQDFLDFLDSYLISSGNGSAIDALLGVITTWELDAPQITAIGSTGMTFTSPTGQTLEIAGSGFGPITSITDLEAAFNDWAAAMLALDGSGTATLDSITLRDASSNILGQLTLTAGSLALTVGDLEVKFTGSFPTSATALTNIILEFYSPSGSEAGGTFDGALLPPEFYNPATALAAAYGVTGIEVREAGVLQGEVTFTPGGAVATAAGHTGTMTGTFPLTLADWIEAMLNAEAGNSPGILFNSLIVENPFGGQVFEISYPGLDLAAYEWVEGSEFGDHLSLDGYYTSVLALGAEGNDYIDDYRWDGLTSWGAIYDDILDGGPGSDVIFSYTGDDLILPGANDGGDSILIGLGDKTVDFDAASEAPISYYHLDYTTAAWDIMAEQGLAGPAAMLFDITDLSGHVWKGWTGGSARFYTDTLLNMDQINGDLGGLGITAGAGDDVANLSISAPGSWVSFEGLQGDDTIIGSENWEVLRHASWAGSGITVTATGGDADGNDGTVLDEFGDTDTFEAIEEVRGTSFDDYYHGSVGDDRFIPYGGNNYFDGGAGFDRVRYDQSNVHDVYVDMRDGSASVLRDTGDPFGLEHSFDTLISVEHVRMGRAGQQTFIGADVDERVRGRGEWNDYDMGGGDDYVEAYYGGEHYVRGGEGSDTVRIYAALGDLTVDVQAGYVAFDDGNGYYVEVDRDVEVVSFSDVTVDLPVAFEYTDAGVLGEVGTVTVEQAGSDQWHTVLFADTIENAVVVMGPPSFAGAQPLNVRVRNVTDAGFEFQLDEWDYLDGGHIAETVSWIAISEGEHTLADGRRISAGETSSNHDFANGAVSFDRAFDAAPIVLTQAASVNGAAAVTTRVSGVSADGFSTRVQEEQGGDGFHAYEDIGWIAVEAGTNPAEGIVAGINGAIGSAGGALSYGTGFSAAPALFASIQSYNGPDPAALRYTANTATGASVFTEEEDSFDAELFHANEAVGFLALETGVLAGARQGMQAGTALVDQADSNEWHYVAFDAPIADAVVVMGPPSLNGEQPLNVRVRNVTDAGFEFQLDEWDYLDGGHIAEHVGWFAISAGEHTLGNGETIVAGRANTNHTFTEVDMGTGFGADTPFVFAQVASTNGAAATAARIRNVDSDSFEVLVQEEQGADGFHAVEEINWIAVHTGVAPDPEGVDSLTVGSSATAVDFDMSFGSTPVVLATMQSYAGPDPASLRLGNLSSYGFDLLVQEETSADAEMDHADELVAWAAISAGYEML
ncbi:hypothetical protein ACQ5SO_10365 [Rhodovulum sp. DZ06]|uniref:hypothetical protein n=1 Tax=Rhodovulum sp. DZ06 TaxID=3425126 RepID=UPI003D338B31